jgi:glycosyltransferase involved in cell wall biosynthesis
MDLGSCREVISDGVTGILVSDADEAVRGLELVRGIKRRACRRRVEECFSVECMVGQYERVYATVLEREARGFA